MKEDKEKIIIYGMYCNYIREIKHYDSIQTHFRLLASTILLAAFAAIGFVFSTRMSALPFERSFVVLIIMAISSVTLIIFWNIDLVFYEKQLVSHFAEALKLENENDWLPKVHHNMLFGKHKKDRPSNIVYYYIGCICSIIFITGLIISLNFFHLHHRPILALIVILSALILIVLVIVILKKKTKRMLIFMKEIKPESLK